MEHHLQDLTQLAIIGNGFDLAHGYHTRYVDSQKALEMISSGSIVTI